VSERVKLRRPERSDRKPNRRDAASGMGPNEGIAALVRNTYLEFRRAMHSQLHPRKITTAQWVFLRILWQQDGLTQKELSALVGNHPSTTVDAVRVLERHGYVRRERDPEDGRAIRAYLTDAGRELRETLMPFAMRVNEVALQSISDVEFEAVRDILAKVRLNLQAWSRSPD
jgi:DNA-binding MarR family transcriptional regulator